ncbi:MAG: hypothetical protein CMM25_09120, partial [Rhodospirillaceae bacterium]|nr:hypothetical protein [Rhodospirillaceae bacterium]
KKLTERIIPNIDTREPDTFAFYGSAEKYYENSFSYIHNSYPYDGSGLEKIQWSLSASVIDLAILQHEYPKESGSVNFSPSGWGSVSATSGIYSLSNNPEYVKFSGGPYVGSVIDSSTGRESSLKIDPASGNTVEFWLKKNSFVSSLTKTEVIFDSHTIDFSEGQSGYGRFLLEMSASGDGGSPFYLTYMSGTVGLDRVRLGESITNASVADGSWHHYAFAVQHTGSNLISDVYVDGKYNSSLMTVTASIGSVSNYFNGTIGALATSKDSNGGIGYGKLSGSIDEFRFWKTSRTADQIGNYYDFPVNGATDKEQINSILGIYYKFNEGIVSEANTDKVVLDYSGRLNNGEFIGYGSSSRSLTSAIDSSTVTDQVELGDPIMNPNSEKVKSALLTLTNIASSYDEYNNSSLFKTVPQWAYEPKAGSNNFESDFSILLQAIASKFDSIKLLIDGLPKIGFKTYSDFSFAKGSVDYKPGFYSLLGCERDLSYSFNQIGTKEAFSYQNLLARGTDLEEFPIVNKTDLGEYFNNVRLGVTDPSTDLGFSMPAGSAEAIKSKILNSIYCNLQEIYETKGTEASFRNVIRCFGTDEKLIAPNIYINNGEIILKDDPIFEDVEIKSLGLYNSNNTTTLYQTSTAPDERHYIQGLASGSATYETKMVFPSDSASDNTYVNTSIFGVNQVSSSALVITTPNTAGFRVSATKSKIENKGGYFKLSSSAGIFNAITSDYYDNIFNNTTWNLSVRFSEDTDLKLSDLNYKSGKSYKVEFSGHQYELDVLVSNFNLSSSISEANYNSFIQANKSVYLGAERQKVTGSLTNYSEAKYLSLSVWDDYLETAELKEHAKSADNLGRFLAFHEQTNNNGSSRLKSDALALNWQFDSTTINSSILQIDDHASGSTSDISVFGPIVGYKYPAKSTTLGSSTSAVMTEDLNFVKYVPIDNARGKSRIEIKEREIDSFELDSRPLGYVYSFEKSMYQVISREMLKMLAGVSAYNNLIGEPVYKYRQEYKSLEKLRERFFRKVENEIDLERFIEYYKWLDSSLGKMLQQLQPATSDMHLGIEDVIESHALERNKYKHQAPTFEFKDPKFVGQILGINELLYDWEHGHAPLAMQDWANATATITTTGNPGNNETFTLIPALPFSVSTAAPVSFIFKTAVTTVDGTKDGDNVIIGINGATGHAASVGDRMRAAINNSIAALTAIETSGGQMTLTQTFAGKSGNTAVDMSSVATTTATDFTGGTGEFEDDNCLWWQDRAERNKVLSVTDAPNDERETLKTRANTIVSGSTYVIRKLSRPYKFSVERQKVLDLGSNRNANKNKDLYKVINSGKEIKLEKANIYDFKQCDDVINPQEERLYTAVIDTTGTSGYLDADADMMLPFSFYSSSVGTDFSNFKTELKITNNHDDHMSHLQGPFVREHVGGMPHARVKFGTADNLRPEAYILSASSTTFTVKKFDGAKSIISRGPNRFYSLANVRTNTASSPVVVGNYDKVYEIVQAHGRSSNNRLITRSGSISVTPLSPGRVSGTIDYTVPTRFRSEHIIVNMFSAPGGPETMAHGSRDLESGEFSIYNTINYRNLSVREPLELLHRERTEQFGYRKDRSAAAALASATITTTGNPANDQTFTLVESSGLAVTFVFKTGVATVDGTKDGSNVIIGINGAAGHAASVGDRMRTAIAASDLSVTVAEVSAGVMTVTQTTVGTSGNTEIDMSSVDTTTATNFSGGVDPAQASLHMTNRNYFYSVVSGSDGNIYGETKEPDNFFVQHPIPQNDTQYGWITASTTTGKVDFVKANAGFGHQHSFTTGSKTALEFLTASTDDSSFPEAKLLASDGGADDYFGYAVSYYGNTAVIGAYQDDDEGSNAGAAYIYTRLDNGTWKQSQKITASDAAANDYFGISVSIDDDLLVIGANGEDAGGSQAGAAYIFQNIAGTWTQASKIVPTTHAANDYFGFGVDVNQGSVVVGSLRINTSTGIGGAYVFQRSSKGLWQEIRQLAPSALGTADQFGYGAVAIDGKTIVAGAHFDDDQGTNAGKVYVFEASGSWSDQPTQTLTVSSTGGQKLGKPVAIHKDVIAAGALGVASDAGAVRIFEKSGTTWSHSKLLYPSDLSASDQFGFSISVYEDVVAVGAPSQNSSLGAVYIFEKINNQWKQVKKLRPHNLTAGDKFGSSVSLHQDTLYVGSYAAHGPAADQGAAYVFKKHGKSWADSNLNYAGVNLDIVESVISGSNTITPETNANIYQLNLHRHGPHGWPSWKQIRGYEHPVAKIHKKNNIFSRVFMGTPQKNKNFNNKAMFFDGNDGNASFLEINSTRTIFKNSEGFSVFTWVKHRQTDDTQSHNILVINTSAGGNRLAFGLKGTDATAYTAPGTLSLYQANGPGWQKSSYKRLDDNKWYHVGFVYNKIDDNNATAELYIDGVSQGAKFSILPLDGQMSGTDTVSIGQDYDSGPTATDFWRGYIADFAIWDIALTDAQVENLVKYSGIDSRAKGPIDLLSHSANENLKAWYRMGDGKSGNISDGILTSREDVRQNRIWNMASPGGTSLYRALPTGASASLTISIEDVSKDLPGDYSILSEQSIVKGTADSATNAGKVYFDGSENVYERARKLDVLGSVDALGLAGQKIGTYDKIRVTKNYKDIPITNRFKPVSITFHGATAPTVGTTSEQMEWFRGADPRLPQFFKRRENIQKLTQPSREHSWKLDSLYYQNLTRDVFLGEEIELSNLGKYATSFGQVAMRKTFQNDITTFAEMQIVKDSFAKEDTRHEFIPFFNIIASDIASQYDKLIELNYIETIYPREINTFTKNSRQRENFKFHGWNSTRANRNDFLSGNIQHKSDEPLLSETSGSAFPKRISNDQKDYKKSFFGLYDAVDVTGSIPGSTSIRSNISASTWVLDSRKDLTVFPVNITSSYFTKKSAFLASRDQGTRGEGLLQNDFSTFPLGYNGLYGTPPFSLVYNRRIPQVSGSDEYLAGEAVWEAVSGNLGPFYNSYEDYAFHDIRPIAQDHSIIPEFRISEFAEEVLNNERDYPDGKGMSDAQSLSYWSDFLSVTGAIYANSSGDLNVGGQFFKSYSNSDFMKYFEVLDDEIVKNDHQISHSRITLKCKAAMKFLPYRGFYPAERVTQIYELFHKNYLSEEVLARAQIRRDAPMTKTAISRYLDLRANASRFQAAKPLFGPGILMNSIKAGVAVDYPIFTGSFSNVRGDLPATGSLNSFTNLSIAATTTFTGSLINNTVDMGIPRISSSVTQRVQF